MPALAALIVLSSGGPVGGKSRCSGSIQWTVLADRRPHTAFDCQNAREVQGISNRGTARVRWPAESARTPRSTPRTRRLRRRRRARLPWQHSQRRPRALLPPATGPAPSCARGGGRVRNVRGSAADLAADWTTRLTGIGIRCYAGTACGRCRLGAAAPCRPSLRTRAAGDAAAPTARGQPAPQTQKRHPHRRRGSRNRARSPATTCATRGWRHRPRACAARGCAAGLLLNRAYLTTAAAITVILLIVLIHGLTCHAALSNLPELPFRNNFRCYAAGRGHQRRAHGPLHFKSHYNHYILGSVTQSQLSPRLWRPTLPHRPNTLAAAHSRRVLHVCTPHAHHRIRQVRNAVVR